MKLHGQTKLPVLPQFPGLAFLCQKKEDAACKEKTYLISRRMNCVSV